MRDPFKIDGPTCISFSGGRTSALMLWMVLQANGGLPAGAVVVFANTGKEEEATLDFVADMGLRPDGMTIDRKDRAGNYEPSNCQWASELDQQRNRGGVKLTVEIARAIRDRVANGEPRARVARDVGIDASAVSRIVTGESWRDA